MEIKKFVRTPQDMDTLNNGAWVGDLEGAPGVRLKVRGLQSATVRKAMEAKQAEIRANKGRKGKPLSDDEIGQAFKETVANAVLMDWEGFTSDGQPLAYSPELARSFIMGDEGEQFRELVVEAAKSLAENPAEFVEEAGKD